tara:strand:+ start:1017 stop:1283 length:267 start_codon:yes stop_codon:yes gene_type:complete
MKKKTMKKKATKKKTAPTSAPTSAPASPRGAKPGNSNAMIGRTAQKERIAFRCTPAERKKIEAAARRSGTATGRWVREQILELAKKKG